jgi:hypothetical protein
MMNEGPPSALGVHQSLFIIVAEREAVPATSSERLHDGRDP